MKDPTGSPCRECPFRRNSLQGYLGAASPEQFVVTANSGETPMPCHMEVNYERKNWRLQQEKAHQCSGHAIFLTNSCKLPRNPDVKTLPADHKKIFSWPHEMLGYHTNGRVTNVVEAAMKLYEQSLDNDDSE